MIIQEIIEKWEKELLYQRTESKKFRSRRMGKELSKSDAKIAIIQRLLCDLKKIEKENLEE